MLTITRRFWLATASAALGVVLAGAAVAAAVGADRHAPVGLLVDLVNNGGADCPDGDRNCDVWDEQPGGPPPPGGGPGHGGGSSGGGCYFDNGSGAITISDDRADTVGLVLAAQTGRIEVPCYHSAFGWYDGSRCYYGDFPPLMAIPEPPTGKNDDDGRWYYRTCVNRVYGLLPDQYFETDAGLHWEWFDFDDVPTVTPEDVARAWLASAALDGVRFQLSPPETGSGLIGLPVWLGVDESTTSAWGPIGASHCIDDVCVTITAQVSHVEWWMGDGASFTCARDQHVVWQRGVDFRAPGGNCHHYYQRASRQPDRRYQITATSHWEVQWSSTGDSGILTTERDATASLQIDEVQVLITR